MDGRDAIELREKGQYLFPDLTEAKVSSIKPLLSNSNWLALPKLYKLLAISQITKPNF